MSKRKAKRRVTLTEEDKLRHLHPRRLRDAIRSGVGNHCGLWGGRTREGKPCARAVTHVGQKCPMHQRAEPGA